MPCVRWVFDVRTDKAHAVRTDANDIAVTALCGRELPAPTTYCRGQEICAGCTSRDEEIHRTADHAASTPRPSSPRRRRAPATRGGGL